MFGRRLKRWYPVFLVLLFVAGGVGLLFLLPDEPQLNKKPLPQPTSPITDEKTIDPPPSLLEDEADREIEKDFPDLLELPDPIEIPKEQDPE